MPDVYLQQPDISGDAAEASRVSGNEAQQPPCCNTGVQSANVSLDWLQGTIKFGSAKELKRLIPLQGDEWQETRSTWNNCRRVHRLRIGEGVVLVGEDMIDYPGYVHYQVSGTACQAIGLDVLRNLAEVTVKKGGHFTRVDLAFDDRSGTLNTAAMWQSVKAGQCVTRARKIYQQEGHKEGHSIYFGSESSETRVVVYDKAAEQREKGKDTEGPWVRVEARYRQERANLVGMGLASKQWDAFKMLAVGNLIGALDFRDTTAESESWERARAERLSWWARFTDNLEKAHWVVVTVTKTVHEVADWFKDQLAASVAVLMTHRDYGADWLVQMCDRAIDKQWRQRHWDMVKVQRPQPAQVGV